MLAHEAVFRRKLPGDVVHDDRRTNHMPQKGRIKPFPFKRGLLVRLAFQGRFKISSRHFRRASCDTVARGGRYSAGLQS